MISRSDLVNKAGSASPVGPGPSTNAAYFFHGSLRTHILGTNKKDDGLHKSEGVLQHELFHFSVVGAAPVGPCQERPADFDLAGLFVIAIESRGSDDSAIFGIQGD
jgi:hypothetical protein